MIRYFYVCWFTFNKNQYSDCVVHFLFSNFKVYFLTEILDTLICLEYVWMINELIKTIGLTWNSLMFWLFSHIFIEFKEKCLNSIFDNNNSWKKYIWDIFRYINITFDRGIEGLWTRIRIQTNENRIRIRAFQNSDICLI